MKTVIFLFLVWYGTLAYYLWEFWDDFLTLVVILILFSGCIDTITRIIKKSS